ncbi:MAG: cytochrome C assembly protein, partial [Prevotella sp.]|nr:cytochrome C assembly protein [Prevotella sp.]
TWLCYLIYIHLRLKPENNLRAALLLLIFAFCCLQMCWWGINYLPSAQGISIHTYNLN